MGFIMTAPALLSDIKVRLVEIDETLALRKAVLRPWLTLEDARATYVGAGEHFHVGALLEGRLVSTAGFVTETQADHGQTLGRIQWRLRGMASEPALQGRGLGGKVLSFGMAELARRLGRAGQPGAGLWCSGRLAAQSFYERHGFAPIGEIFETPGTGPHYIFWRHVAAA
jgi:GNAT superfamily N-acetyltransferase